MSGDSIGKGPGWSCPACDGRMRPDQLGHPLRIAHAAHVAARAAMTAPVPRPAEEPDREALCTHGSDDGEPCWLPEDHDGDHDFMEPPRPEPICCDYKWTAMTQAARDASSSGLGAAEVGGICLHCGLSGRDATRFVCSLPGGAHQPDPHPHTDHGDNVSEDEDLRAAPWSCVTDHVTFPGCGTCGPCRQALAAGWTALAARDADQGEGALAEVERLRKRGHIWKQLAIDMERSRDALIDKLAQREADLRAALAARDAVVAAALARATPEAEEDDRG